MGVQNHVLNSRLCQIRGKFVNMEKPNVIELNVTFNGQL